MAASSRARRILNLVSPLSQAVGTESPDQEYSNQLASNVMSVDDRIAAKENISPCRNVQNLDPSESMMCYEEICSFDKINNCNIDLSKDCQMNIETPEQTETNMVIPETIPTQKINLVADYDSDDHTEDNICHRNENNVAVGIEMAIPVPHRSSSSSSSSSSSASSSSSSSSSSDSEQSSKGNKIGRIEDAQLSSHHVREQRDIIIPNASRSYNISPIYTDESDIDLSDEDPTFDYENMLNRGNKKRNYLFDQTNMTFTVSSSDPSDTDNSNSMTKKINKRGRKRTKNPSKWKQNQVKKLRNTGEAYTTMFNSQKQMPSRCLKVPCTDKCKLKCTEKIDTESRYNIFREFWDLGELSKQRAYINKCMAEIKPKYRYTNAENPRRSNNAYYLTSNKSRIRVCKTFFKSTLGISDRMIFTIQSKINEGGVLLEDQRGKHGNHKKNNPVLLDAIRKHIDSIPRIESHYVRATTSRQYIDGSKTIKDLYNDFAVQQNENNKEQGNYITYYKIFNTEFNLSFFQPKKDICDLCTSYINFTEEKRKEIEEKHSTHLEEKNLTRIEKKNDRKNVDKNNKVVIYDLEAVLQCPKGESSSFFYKSKLNSYNLTCTELTDANSKTAYDVVHCYFWTEADAKRGAIEIGTCVWEYLDNLCKEGTEEKNVIFYSDNCCGQNKNKFITTLYMFAVQSLNVKTITHKFLIRGHTQNEADGVHSLIEKEIKKNLKSGPIYSPDQYIALIKNAKKSKPSIKVHEMTFESFMDLKKLQEEWGYNFNTDTEGQAVNWNNIKVLMMKKETPFSFYYKNSYKDDSFREVDVRNKRKKMNIMSEITLQRAYTQMQELSENKKKDLKELLSKGLIPSYYASFYNSIIN